MRPLPPDEVAPAARLVARAFAEEPTTRVMFPDARDAVRMGERKAAKLIRSALPLASVHGVHLGGELVGVAIWHPPGVRPGSAAASLSYARGLFAVPVTVASGLRRAAAVARVDARAIGRLLLQRRAAVREAGRGTSWYLAVLATDPAHQGRGVARALLEHVLARCDADGLPAWLETTDARNPPIYERFGFVVVRAIPGGERTPGLWVMRREPATRGASAPAPPGRPATRKGTAP